MFLKGIFSSLFLLFSLVSGQEEEYVRGQNPQADAIRDMQVGFTGLQQAASDPVLMAQLMQDLQVCWRCLPSETMIFVKQKYTIISHASR
jgi:hypothetical protein